MLPAFHLHPFPLLCAAVCVSTGRLRTLHCHGDLAVVLALSKRIRCIETVNGDRFWVPRCVVDRKFFKRQRQQRRFRNCERRGLRNPWFGEQRPAGAVSVELTACTGSIDEVEALRVFCRRWEIYPPVPLTSLWVYNAVYKYVRPSRGKHAYISASVRKAEERRVWCVIEDRNWSQEVKKVVHQIVYGGKRPREVAAVTGLSPKLLSTYAKRVETELSAASVLTQKRQKHWAFAFRSGKVWDSPGL